MRSPPPTTIATTILLVSVLAGQARAEDWNQFRGPNADGVAKVKSVPTHWSPQENVAWKTPLPQPCNGSPIVSKGIVFVASPEDSKGHGRSLYAFDMKDGAKLWGRTVDFGRDEPTHQTNPFCGTTPAADGERVVVWHSSAGLFCYDYQGEQKWSHEFGDFVHMWGYGTSPIIHNGIVFLHTGPGMEKVSLIAIRMSDGKILWKQDEPIDGNGERNSAEKYMGSWATPVITHHNGRDIVVCAFSTRVNAYSAESGELLFYCNGLRGDRGDLAYSSPLIIGDICVARGGFQGPSLAFKLGGTGNVTDSHGLWRNTRNPQNIGSGIAFGDHYFMANAGPGTIQCMNLKTGKEAWVARGADNHWASLVLAGGHLYATAQDGTVTVFRPNTESYDVVAANQLGERSNATPAFVEGAIIFRSMKNLYCLRQQ